MMRVLLADDHALVRAGIHSLLQGMREVQVVAEASSGEEALEVADRERPDVVLMRNTCCRRCAPAPSVTC
jgi:DNA-binding NarL/FixJ family response regulator